jgi:hypothetical protein
MAGPVVKRCAIIKTSAYARTREEFGGFHSGIQKDIQGIAEPLMIKSVSATSIVEKQSTIYS